MCCWQCHARPDKFLHHGSMLTLQQHTGDDTNDVMRYCQHLQPPLQHDHADGAHDEGDERVRVKSRMVMLLSRAVRDGSGGDGGGEGWGGGGGSGRGGSSDEDADEHCFFMITMVRNPWTRMAMMTNIREYGLGELC